MMIISCIFSWYGPLFVIIITLFVVYVYISCILSRKVSTCSFNEKVFDNNMYHIAMNLINIFVVCISCILSRKVSSFKEEVFDNNIKTMNVHTIFFAVFVSCILSRKVSMQVLMKIYASIFHWELISATKAPKKKIPVTKASF